jgi:hypothetical protein
VRHLLYGEGYTIRGVQRILREEGLSFVQSVWRTGAKDLPAVDFPDEDETAAAELEGDADDNAEGEDESEDDENAEVEAAVRPREPSFFSEPPTTAMRPDERREPTLVPQSSHGPPSHGPQSSAVPPAAAPARLSAESQSRQKLEAALDELIACRSLIQAVLTDTALPPERSDEAG